MRNPDIEIQCAVCYKVFSLRPWQAKRRIVCGHSCRIALREQKARKASLLTNMVWTKKCPSCKEILPICKFNYSANAQIRLKRSSYCKICSNERTERYRLLNRESLLAISRNSSEPRKTDPKINRRRYLKKNYNLTPHEFDRLFKSQDGKCKICGRNNRQLNVDHCHKTGHVRGLLCKPCNTALGAFNDDIYLVEIALNYLKETQS